MTKAGEKKLLKFLLEEVYQTKYVEFCVERSHTQAPEGLLRYFLAVTCV